MLKSFEVKVTLQVDAQDEASAIQNIGARLTGPGTAEQRATLVELTIKKAVRR